MEPGCINGEELLLHRPASRQLGRSPRAGPRLVDRDGPFGQSYGRMHIRRANTGMARALRRADWFHTAVYLGTPKLLAGIACIHVASWVVIALLLMACPAQCGLAIQTFGEALLEAITIISTIGFGLRNDPYMHGCTPGILVVGLAVLWGLLLDAVTIGVVFQRIARGQNRASTIIFSDKAVVRHLNGSSSPCFVFQVGEMRKHQIIEAHVRMYCVSHVGSGRHRIPFQTHAMRLQQPDDELGGLLLLAIPQQVVHRVDAWSPLLPPPTVPAAPASPAARSGSVTASAHDSVHDSAHDTARNASSTYAFPDTLQRVNDFETGNREVVGASGPAAVAAAVRAGDGATPAAIAALMADTDAEVLVLVEGIDPSTSYTLQARHSYKREDIVFGGGGFFAPCVTRDPADGACVIDFAAFHTIRGGPGDTNGPGLGQPRSAVYEGEGEGAKRGETARLHHQSHA